MTASLTVGTYTDKAEPNKNNAITAFSINLTEGYAIVVKGGDGANVYRNATQTDIPLHAPAVAERQVADDQPLRSLLEQAGTSARSRANPGDQDGRR